LILIIFKWWASNFLRPWILPISLFPLYFMFFSTLCKEEYHWILEVACPLNKVTCKPIFFLNLARWLVRSRLRFWILTRSTGSISILIKIQNDIVLEKKINELQPDFWSGFAGSTGSPVNPPGQSGHTGSWLFYFFINPVLFQPRISRVPGRPVRPGRVSKLCANLPPRACDEHSNLPLHFLPERLYLNPLPHTHARSNKIGLSEEFCTCLKLP
jgi:hypothetical protein